MPTGSTSNRAATERPGKLAAFIAALLTAAACSPGSFRSFDPVEAVAPTYHEDLERDIGWEFDRNLADKARFIDDPVVLEFMNELGQAIVRETEPQPFVYRFRLIESRSLNAFAVFGGYVYFHSETLRAAGSLEELAGVMGHEVAHVRQRHHARMAEKSQIPDLVAGVIGLAAIAGAAVSGEGGALVAGQGILGINQAIKLRFSRGFEAEADEYGIRFMARAGYDPRGIERFFRRLLDAKRSFPDQIPPYLYSHPAVEDRIDAVEIRAAGLTPAGPPRPDLESAFRDAQARLALLDASGRDSWIQERLPEETPSADLVLDRAAKAEAAADATRALALLEEAAQLAPGDPRIAFRTAELLHDQRRLDEAVIHYRRTIDLDPTRALVFFRLGEAYKAQGDPPRAIYAFEQAVRRAGRNSSLQRRAVWEIEKLGFPVIRNASVADTRGRPGAVPRLASVLLPDLRELMWSAELGPHFAPHVDRIAVRWTEPGDGTVHTTRVAMQDGRLVARLRREAGVAPGEWRAEAHIDDDPLGAQLFQVAAP